MNENEFSEKIIFLAGVFQAQKWCIFLDLHHGFCTLLSHAKSHDKVLLLNFDPEYIKVNESALKEMVRIRQIQYFHGTARF